MLFMQAHTDNTSHSQRNSMKNNSFTAALEAEKKPGHCAVQSNAAFLFLCSQIIQ